MADADWLRLNGQLNSVDKAGPPLGPEDAKLIRQMATQGWAPVGRLHAELTNKNNHHMRRVRALVALRHAGAPMSALMPHALDILQAAIADGHRESEAQYRREAAERGLSLENHLRQRLKARGVRV